MIYIISYTHSIICLFHSQLQKIVSKDMMEDKVKK